MRLDDDRGQLWRYQLYDRRRRRLADLGPMTIWRILQFVAIWFRRLVFVDSRPSGSWLDHLAGLTIYGSMSEQLRRR
jgi:hypothetical protein